VYTPQHFNVEDPRRLEAFIRDYSFGALVTVADGVPFASHLPFIFDAGRGPKGTLLAHVARANPQWKQLEGATPVLAIFEGPHTYVSPSWYANYGVPTWNYAVVHVYGKPKVLDDKAAVASIVEKLTSIHEARFKEPWTVDLADKRPERMLELIVGFEIEVERIEGKFKMSQNRPVEDRERVIAKLSASESDVEREVAKLMRERLER
jgi:transcriptional regulator